TGSLVNRLNADLMGVQRAFTDVLGNLVGNGVVVAGALAAMATLSWPLTLAALVALPLFGLPVRVLGRRLARLAGARLDVSAAMVVALRRVFRVLDLEPLVTDRPGARTLGRGPVAVEFDRVAFRYPPPRLVSVASLESGAVLGSRTGDRVLHDVSFRAEPGEL